VIAGKEKNGAKDIAAAQEYEEYEEYDGNDENDQDEEKA
jgi:hypothetical protein